MGVLNFFYMLVTFYVTFFFFFFKAKITSHSPLWLQWVLCSLHSIGY